MAYLMPWEGSDMMQTNPSVQPIEALRISQGYPNKLVHHG